jgi:hypothetical protein
MTDATLKVDFSSEEANSEARSFDPIPSGTYHCKITGIKKETCGEQSKNPGKPYWAVEYTVQDGEYERRKVWGNCMLFNGSLYTLAQILKATGNEKALQSGAVPDPDTLITKDVDVIVRKQRNKYLEERDGSDEPIWSNDVKGVKTWDGKPSSGKATGKGGKQDSLLP